VNDTSSPPPCPERCELCGRAEAVLTRHHLIPRTRHANRRNKRDFARDEVRHRIAWLCLPCHKHIHAVLSEKEMEREFNTLEALRAQPEIARFVAWLADKPPGFKPRGTPRRRR